MTVNGEEVQAPGTPRLLGYRRNPGLFFRDVLGWEPWGKQLEIAEAVRDAIYDDGPKRVAVRSGNGVGKTAIAARIMLWALRCWPGAVVITTAPTERQVNELLWREARGAYLGAAIPLGGRFYNRQPRWEIAAQRYALGLSPDNAGPERFQGFHAPLILFILDEASGVPEAHWEAIKGSALAGNAVIFAIGNPTRLHGEFFDAFHGRQQLWRTLAVSAFDTPNFTIGPGSVPGLVGPEAVQRATEDWGEDSSLYAVRILGQFPLASSSSLVQLSWLEDAVTAPQIPGPEALGVDVARNGEAETVIVHMNGNRVTGVEAFRGQDTMRTAGRVRQLADERRGITIAIDDGGVGGGVVDRLREQDVAVASITFGGRPDGRLSEHFKNKLSEMYWVLREDLREGKLVMPNEPRLWAQLTQIEWELESDRAIRVYKRGIGRHADSPDRADALALAVEAAHRANMPSGVFL